MVMWAPAVRTPNLLILKN